MFTQAAIVLRTLHLYEKETTHETQHYTTLHDQGSTVMFLSTLCLYSWYSGALLDLNTFSPISVQNEGATGKDC